ncbi:MAG: alpha/beta hydrolase, partial [Bacteroidales bacterium]|nr:alpha/beta hydrolase [Bacteroidales bacterium]
FFVLADHLTRGGIAVLRYDDRGVGESGGDAVGATSGDLTGDARSAINYLLTRSDIAKDKIGVIGHSEGGLIGLKLAAEDDDIAFLVSLAGPGVKGRTILEDQTEYISRLGGLPEDVIEQSMQVNRKIYSIMEEYEDPQRGIDSILAFVTAFYTEQGMGKEIVDQVTTNISKSINPGSYPWLRYFIKSDPASYFADIKCPVLALNGEKDCQVMAEKNVDALVKGLKDAGNDDVTGKIFPELNHLFQTADSGLPDEYGEIEETMSPEVLDLILQWIRERVK